MIFTTEEERSILAHSDLLVPRYFDSQQIDELRAMYATPQRHYHTWQHALNVLAWANRACESHALTQSDEDAIKLAALFHDCVYDAEGAPRNEERSAAELLKVNAGAEAMKAAAIILATAKHGKLEAGDVDLPTAILLDCDMVTFAEPLWEVAVQNDDDVLAELRERYTEEQIKTGRTAFLTGLLDKHDIFLTPWFRERFEAHARDNIERFIARIS